ncbi:MAG TPA: hypothetical protein VFK91_08710, partial [Methyloceanibacter sp.]|nr:hypothetical protein [Methyloceanibacter sp.]
ELGRWLGTRAADRGGEQVRTLEAAVLGLLALMIAFTFAMALSRYEARRDAVVSEANAIGTTALRARLLPEPHNAETLRLLRDYVKVRLEAAQRAFGAADFDAAIARSGQIQEALWRQAMAVAAKDQNLVPTGLFIDALNKMIDEHEKRLTAFRNHVPNIVLLSLYGVAMVAGAFSGYAGGVGTRSSRLPAYVMISLICAVILLILDLDRPSAGFIRTSQQPMIDTAAAIANY